MASLPGKNATSTDRQRCPVGGLHNLIRSVVELRRGLPGPGAAQVLVGHLQLVNPLVQRDELFSPGQFAAWPSMVRVVCVLGHEVSTRPRTTSAPASSHGPRQITAVGLPSRKVRWANATVVPSVRSLSALATPPGRTSAPWFSGSASRTERSTSSHWARVLRVVNACRGARRLAAAHGRFSPLSRFWRAGRVRRRMPSAASARCRPLGGR